MAAGIVETIDDVLAVLVINPSSEFSHNLRC
jgi:hypothetical protein